MVSVLKSSGKSNAKQRFADLEGFPDAAHRWRDEGYLPIPLGLNGNGNFIPATKWGAVESVSVAEIESWFGPECAGIAIKTGVKSGGVIDIDLDCPEAVRLAPRFLPDTKCIFGRPGNPTSHYLYRVKHQGPITKTTFASPGGGKPIVEILADGQISTVPPTVKHKYSKPETVRFESGKAGLPSFVAYAELRRSVSHLAVASVILRLYPAEGFRHDAALALSGALLRADLSVEDTKRFIEVIAKAANDPEVADRLEAVTTTAAKLAKDEACWGWPRLAELLGDEVNVCVKWLGVDAMDKNSGDLGYFECSLSGAELAQLKIPPPEWLIEGVMEKGSITLVQGQYKTFKTFTAYGFAEGLCRGMAFVEYPVPEKRRVALFDGEMPIGQAQNRYKKMIGPAGHDRFLIQSNHSRVQADFAPIDITDERHQQEIEKILTAHKSEVVIFDNYAALRSLVDENNAADPKWHALRRWLIDLRFKGLAVVLIHHTGHGGRHARGTSELPGLVDTIIHQDRISETAYKISFTCRGPQPEPGEKIINVVDAGEVIILTGADVKPDDWPAILKVINDCGSMTQKKIGVKLGEAFGTKSWGQGAVSKKLQEGREKGYIGKDKKLTEAGMKLIL